jgi:hypothetical protein
MQLHRLLVESPLSPRFHVHSTCFDHTGQLLDIYDDSRDYSVI